MRSCWARVIRDGVHLPMSASTDAQTETCHVRFRIAQLQVLKNARGVAAGSGGRDLVHRERARSAGDGPGSSDACGRDAAGSVDGLIADTASSRSVSRRHDVAPKMFPNCSPAAALHILRQSKKEPICSPSLLSGRQDLNLRPPGPQPGALPDCATPRGKSGRRESNPP